MLRVSLWVCRVLLLAFLSMWCAHTLQSTAQWQERKRNNFDSAVPKRHVVPNLRLPTPDDPNNADCTQLRTMGVPKRRSCAPPAAGRRAGPPKPARLDALRSSVRMTDLPVDNYQPSHIVQVHSPRAPPPGAGGGAAAASPRTLKAASERTRTPKQKLTARPPEMPKTERVRAPPPAVLAGGQKPKVASPPASKPNSPAAAAAVTGWLTPRLADELADRERERRRALITVARNPPPGPQEWLG